ncbi:MAG: sulfate adenylyltransferase subunit CysD [Gammaproteobacteria bacterium]
MRLAGESLAAIREATGLSAPTVSSAWKAFVTGGWPAVALKSLGRRTGQGRLLLPEQERALKDAVFLGGPVAQGLTHRLWSVAAIKALLRTRWNLKVAESTVLRYLGSWGLDLTPLRDVRPGSDAEAGWLAGDLPRYLARARARRAKIVRVGQLDPGNGTPRLLCGTSLRGRPEWLPLTAANQAGDYLEFFAALLAESAAPLWVLLHGVDPKKHAALSAWIVAQGERLTIAACPIELTRAGGAEAPRSAPAIRAARRALLAVPPPAGPQRNHSMTMTLTHLQRLEAEAIHILREVVAEADKPVMLYSVGKDSACMLRLAQKAFFPAVPPFPLLHVDTTWKFREMYAERARVAAETGMELLIHQNPEARAQGINPFDHGSQIHTDMWKTQGLRQALEKYGFDAAFGGARRDEEKSRAKERIFSFRNAQHRWDPKAQRPELWHLYNARKGPGESIRAFPLSNWTELDVWQYIQQENIRLVPLYFAKERPVVERDGTWIMVDDERMPLNQGEVPVMRKVRFRTLGCYPLSGGIESSADSLTGIIQEMLLARTSERQGRLIDHDQSASMEKKKQEGYF